MFLLASMRTVSGGYRRELVGGYIGLVHGRAERCQATCSIYHVIVVEALIARGTAWYQHVNVKPERFSSVDSSLSIDSNIMKKEFNCNSLASHA